MIRKTCDDSGLDESAAEVVAQVVAQLVAVGLDELAELVSGWAVQSGCVLKPEGGPDVVHGTSR
jgi:hypothetical protein